MIHNLEAEQSVIASVLLDNDCLETFTRLKPSHFYAPAHRIIYEAICYLATKNVAVDLVTLSDAAATWLSAKYGCPFTTSL